MRSFVAAMLVGIALLAPVAASAAPPIYSDDFNRADGPLGSYWEELPFGPLPTISSNQACTGFGSETVAPLAGTVDPAFDMSGAMQFTTSDLSNLIFGWIFASVSPSGAPTYAHYRLRPNGMGQHTLRIEGNVGGTDTVYCETSPLTLSAGTIYQLYTGLTPTGDANTQLFAGSSLLTFTQCNVGTFTPNRVVILAGDNSSTAGVACFDNFEVYGVAGPTCSDGVQNGTETDVDCGGSCSPCNDGHNCSVGADCTSGVCGPAHCESPTCTDGVQNGGETGVDCGGSCSAACPTCSDGVQNGTETGVDCGGSCSACSVGGCSSMPLSSCRVGTKSALKLTNNASDDAKDSFAWDWGKGPDTSYADLGDPTVDAAYQLCIYGASHSILEAQVPAAGTCGDDSCWSAKLEKSFTFKDKAGTNDGITSVKLGGGIDGKAKLSVKGKGANLQDVSVPLTATVTVQLQNLDSGLCWASIFPSDAIKTNDPEKGKFQAAVKP